MPDLHTVCAAASFALYLVAIVLVFSRSSGQWGRREDIALGLMFVALLLLPACTCTVYNRNEQHGCQCPPAERGSP